MIVHVSLVARFHREGSLPGLREYWRL